MNDKRWLDEALEEMRAGGRPGIAIVIPDAHPCLGELSERFQRLFCGLNADLLRRAVYVCLRESTALDRFGDTSTLLALDPAGRVLRAKAGPPEELLEWKAFEKALDVLLADSAAASGIPRHPLPYGLAWDEEQHHKLFGTSYDPCPTCGMPSFQGASSNLVRYLRLLDGP